jgi:hypothetical protein
MKNNVMEEEHQLSQNILMQAAEHHLHCDRNRLPEGSTTELLSIQIVKYSNCSYNNMVQTANLLDIQFDKASKFYEPLENVTGTISVVNAVTYTDHGEVSLLAEGFMDTVSAIRGNLGRSALKPENRVIFMSKTLTVCPAGKTVSHEPLKFKFLLEKTGSKPLIDAYVGVDFSIVYKVTIKMNIGGKLIEGKAEFYCSVPGSGLDPVIGKKLVFADYEITPEAIASTVKAGTKIPKFNFSG